MKITRTDPFTGTTNTLELEVTQKQIDDWRGGILIQDAMPNLSPSEREFIKTGIFGTSWDDHLPEDPPPVPNPYPFKTHLEKLIYERNNPASPKRD